MNNRFKQSIRIVVTMFISSTAFANPDWKAIDDARKEKHEAKVAEVQQKTKHEIALQKLQDACARVKGNAELADACRAILDADTEAQSAR